MDSLNPTARKIIRSTLSVLGNQGIEGLTTKNISEASNLSTGIIHHYFDTKENLVYLSYLFFIRHLHRNTVRKRKKTTDPHKLLWKMVKIHFGEVQASREAATIWVHFWSQASNDLKTSRLLKIYSRRMLSNFACQFQRLGFDRDSSREKARMLQFILHGAWIEHKISGLISNKEDLFSLLQRQLGSLCLEP